MALFLRRLPEPAQWTVTGAPGEDWPEAVVRSPLVMAWCSGGARVDLERVRGGRPTLALETPLSLGPDGVCRNGARVLAVPAGVRVAVRVLPSIARTTFDRGRALLRALARDLSVPVDNLDAQHHALLCCAERDTGAAGLLASALASAGPQLPLVGGTFQGTVALDGQRRRGGAVVALLASEAPLAAFHVHPFELTGERTVVTRCDDAGRVVIELDGWPAPERFADLAGVEAEALEGPRPAVLRRLDVQLAWVVGGRPVLRPVIGREGRGILLAAGVQRGAVLRLVRRREDVAAALLDGVHAALRTLPTRPAGAWAFACGGFFEPPWGTALVEGLEQTGLLACVVDGAFHGPTHACGSLSGLVWGDVGSG